MSAAGDMRAEQSFAALLGSQRGADPRDGLLSGSPGAGGRRQLDELLDAAGRGDLTGAVQALHAHGERFDEAPLLGELLDGAAQRFSEHLWERHAAPLRDLLDVFGVRPWHAETYAASSGGVLHLNTGLLCADAADTRPRAGAALCGASPGGWRLAARGSWAQPRGHQRRCPDCAAHAHAFAECAEERRYAPLPQPFLACAQAQAAAAAHSWLEVACLPGDFRQPSAPSGPDAYRSLEEVWRIEVLSACAQAAHTAGERALRRALGSVAHADLTGRLGALGGLLNSDDWRVLMMAGWPGRRMRAEDRQQEARRLADALQFMAGAAPAHRFRVHATDALAHHLGVDAF